MTEQYVISVISLSETDIEIYQKSIEWKKSIESLVDKVGDDYGFECSRERVFSYLDDVEQTGLDRVSRYPTLISKMTRNVPKLLSQIVKISNNYFDLIDGICDRKQKEIVGNDYFDCFFDSYKALMGLANRKVNNEPGSISKEAMQNMRKGLKSSNEIYDSVISNR